MEVLLQLRAEWTHEGGTWALPGGAINLIDGRTESAEEAAKREALEEAGIESSQIIYRSEIPTTDHGTWTYTTVIASTDGDAGAHVANAESVEVSWFAIDDEYDFPNRDLDTKRLHSGLRKSWSVLRLEVLRLKVLDSLA